MATVGTWSPYSRSHGRVNTRSLLFLPSLVTVRSSWRSDPRYCDPTQTNSRPGMCAVVCALLCALLCATCRVTLASWHQRHRPSLNLPQCGLFNQPERGFICLVIYGIHLWHVHTDAVPAFRRPWCSHKCWPCCFFVYTNYSRANSRYISF